MSLVVDGRTVGGDGFEYDRAEAVPIPTEADLAPAAVAARECVDRRERPCPEARYLLYPVPWTNRLLDWSGTSVTRERRPSCSISCPTRRGFPSLANVRSS